MPTNDQRLTRLEERVQDMRDDMADLKMETQRTRKRLHDLEGMQALLVNQEKVRHETSKRQQETLKNRLQILTVVVAVAALAEPFIVHAAGGG